MYFTFLILFILLLISVLGLPINFRFEDAFHEFWRTNKYHGAQVGVLVDNRLAYTKAYGKGHDRTNIELLARHPVSAISKAFTSIAVLKLIDEGKLNLSSIVFGAEGLLPEVKPLKKSHMDKRIYDITVENLLFHTAGWDYVHSDVADPMLNSELLKRHATLKNISQEIHSKGYPQEARNVIKYMLSRKLDYTPGTKSVVSNLGYVILGRIIEEVSSFPYEDYVKRSVLFPCGMMHTRIGKVHKCKHHDNDPAFNCEVSSSFVDAALGWESNMYDLARFSLCIDRSEDFSIVSDEMAKHLRSKPTSVQHSDTWMGAGFYVNNKGALWIENERYTDDVLFYHSHPFKIHHEGNKPKSWIVLLHGQNYAPVKQLLHEMIRDETNWPMGNRLLDDVADVTLQAGKTKRIVKYEINEHQLKAYTNAVALLRFDITWVHGHMHSRSTIFTVIAEQKAIPMYDKLIVESGLSEKRLQTQKLHLEKSNYNLTLLHTYRSYSHDKRAVFLAIYRKHAYSNTTIIRYGEEHYTQPYKKLLHLFEERGFYPTSQSIIHSGYDGLVSFILEEDLHSKDKKQFKSYCEIGHHRLNNLVMSSFRHGRRLKYLDSSDYFGKPVFSAIFIKEKTKKMMFNSNIDEPELMNLLTDQQSNGLLPTIIVGYTDKFGNLKYAAYLEPPK